jgi:hypothetical protein
MIAKIFTSVILITLFAASSNAQLDDLLKKGKKQISNITALDEQGTISTTLKDAYPIAFWLQDLDKIRQPVEPAEYSFNLEPGYYRFSVQSYCLHAGTYVKTNGYGYLMAPLMGSRSDIVQNILLRSAEHPDIEQKDVQRLIWNVEDKVKYSDWPNDFKIRVNPLLTPVETGTLDVNPTEVAADLLPDDLKASAKFYSDFRGKLKDPNTPYNELENIAVNQGLPPIGIGSRQISDGNWGAVGDGFYMRCFPEPYQHDYIELYRPRVIDVTKDDKGRITAMTDGVYKMDVTYMDEPGSNKIKLEDGKTYPIWRFKSVHFTGANPGEEYVMENNGWVIPSAYQIKDIMGGGEVLFSRAGDPKLQDYNDRNQQQKDFGDKIRDYIKDKLGDKSYGDNKDTRSLDDADHFKRGMDAALSDDPEKKMQWINKNLDMTVDTWHKSIDALGGNDGTPNNNPKKFDPTKHVSTPGNTSSQRLGNSTRKF